MNGESNGTAVSLAVAGQTKAAAVVATAGRYLTLADLCGRLQCSRTSAWRMIAEHRLPAVKIGRLVRVRESALEEWLQKHEACGNGQQNSVAP